jgi:putative colanic acid biosynthesis UDP-glucose lipid carrier transferase
VRGSPDALASDIAAGGIDQVWIALAAARRETRAREISLDARASTRSKSGSFPTSTASICLNHSVTEIAGLPIISLTETPMSGTNRVYQGDRRLPCWRPSFLVQRYRR